MRLIAVEEKDIKALMESLELEKFRIKKNPHQLMLEDVYRHFHFVVCSWVQEHGSNYPNG
jgi:hypothetical protein